jgi:uncharacterized membrane protein
MFTGRSGRRRGNVSILVVVSLIPIVGVVAIAVDGGVLLSDRRQAQRAADSAALAAAVDLFTNWNKSAGVDSSGRGYPTKMTECASDHAGGSNFSTRC